MHHMRIAFKKKRIIIIFHNITVLLYFRSNNCCLGEHKRLVLKTTTKNLINPIILNISVIPSSIFSHNILLCDVNDGSENYICNIWSKIDNSFLI